LLRAQRSRAQEDKAGGKTAGWIHGAPPLRGIRPASVRFAMNGLTRPR
jgi:hypothetical protein